jgi:1-acyl-sn-glycerol-3-phosphate acyltransferase
MTIDHFDPKDAEAFGGYSAEVSERFYAMLAKLGDAISVELRGLENLPEGRALLVANHAFGWDVGFAIAAIRRETGRTVWALGEHAWWLFPYVRKVAVAVGVVDGSQENADTLLERDQLVLVLPGGLREAVKPRELRYRLLWGNRYGFVRAALRHGAPLVPMASIGADDIFSLVGDAYARGERLLRRHIPLPRLRWPHRARLRFVIGEPVLAVALPGEAEDDACKRIRREVEGALHEIFEHELAARAGIEI